MLLRLCNPRLGVTVVALALVAASGCDCRPRPPARAEGRVPLPLQILADRATGTLHTLGTSDTARAWLGRVSISPPATRVAPSPPGALLPPAPAVGFESLAGAPEPEPPLAIDEDLKPPIPRGVAPVRMPRPGGGVARLELDVRIDELGEVSDALWAAGSRDSAAVAAAIECAMGMRFFPALQRGRPVAVWCRQTFEFSRGIARPAVESAAPPPSGDR